MRRFLQCFIGLLFYAGFAQTGTLQKYIVVDQFGYRPGDDKVAVIADPQEVLIRTTPLARETTIKYAAFQMMRLCCLAVLFNGTTVPLIPTTEIVVGGSISLC